MATLLQDVAETAPTGLDVRRVGGVIGAEIRGVKLAGDLDAATSKAIWAELLRNKVVFFRGQQHLDDAEHRAVCALFGRPMVHATLSKEQAEAGPVMPMDSSEPGGRSDNWHTDGSFGVAPPKASLLRSTRMPEYGGDTCWANTAAAYETLPIELKGFADRARALHANSMSLSTSPKMPEGRGNLPSPPRSFVAEHSVVTEHPETGEHALQLGYFVQRLIGLDRWDSAQMIAVLQRHVEKPEHVVRWNWQVGDFIIWDNRATQHFAVNDYGDKQRHVRRITLEGTPWIGADGRPSVAHEQPENPSY